MADEDIRVLFNIPEKADTIRICGMIPFFAAEEYLSTLYDADKAFVDHVVDFTGVAPEGFGFVADTTGHRYESEEGQLKKKELRNLWDGFMSDVREHILKRFRHEKLLWSEARELLRGLLLAVSHKMQDIGKTSTFSGVFLVWVASVEIKTDPVVTNHFLF